MIKDELKSLKTKRRIFAVLIFVGLFVLISSFWNEDKYIYLEAIGSFIAFISAYFYHKYTLKIREICLR